MEADILAPQFTDADKALELFEAKRWPNGPVCPHCGIIGEATRLVANPGTKTHARKGTWKCRACEKQFSALVGTIFSDSHIPLNKWLLAVHLLCASKKGMSAHQLHRMLGVTYKTAWFMAHRIRYAMSQEPLSSKLGGTVEVDEVYLGGKEKGIGGGPANRLSKKVPVISMVERPLVPGQKGKVRSKAVARVTVENLRPMLNEHIERNATLNTDEAVVYFFAGQEFDDHKVVTHKTKQYVRMAEDGKKVTTNTVESFFALLKRGVHGTYHHISKQHLHRYLNEFDSRYNARDVTDSERADRALSGFDGKHLTYRDSLGKASAKSAV